MDKRKTWQIILEGEDVEILLPHEFENKLKALYKGFFIIFNKGNNMNKKWLSFEEQLTLLQKRGMQIDDESKALDDLKHIGYYRLSGYWYIFREFENKNSRNRTSNFLPETNFDNVIKIYLFDKKLKSLAIDALECIEMAMRVDIAHILGKKNSQAHENGSYLHKNFAETTIKSGKDTGKTKHQVWLLKYKALLARAEKQPFIEHYNKKYEGIIPIWVAVQIWDFGCMSILFSGMQHKDKEKIAIKYGIDPKKLQQWLHNFNHIRNISAHHGRLWNAGIINKATKLDFDLNWEKIEPNTTFFYFCIMQKMLKIICPNSDWNKRFLSLLNDFPQIVVNNINLKKDFGFNFEMHELKQWDLWK